MARMRRELHLLSAALKHSVPFSSPRYIGHMASDLLLPGLIAQMTALPYNPNNVVDEAAPVTVDMEIDAGLQLARMLGMPADETRCPSAFGHLTSGGSVANYESLWLLRAVRFFPLAVRAAAQRCGCDFDCGDRPLSALDDWALFNLPLDQAIALRAACETHLAADADRSRAEALAQAIEAERIETLGVAEFCARHPKCLPPVVIVPVTAHYSWDKAMKLLGLGTANLWRIATRGMRLDPAALDAALARAHFEQRPVLCVVGVLGTTEFGTIDPIHRIVAARQHWQARGLNFGIHIDAAWGGYLASIFRAEDGSLRSHEQVRADFRYFPSHEVYDAFAALGDADSVTVDPHKLGYLPYGAGALVCRDHRVFDFVAQDAPYAFSAPAAPTAHDPRARFRALGRYILEGSKSGAAAAAVYVTHRTLPLDHRHFGRLQRESLLATEYFFDRVRTLADAVADVARLILPFEPDSNLVCIAINPLGNSSLARMNDFTERIYGHLKVDRQQPVQTRQFFGSSTRLSRAALGGTDSQRILSALGIDPATFCDRPGVDERSADSMLILRHTLMNPWLRDAPAGTNYLDLYCDYLAGLIRSELRGGVSPPASGTPPPAT
ncbi:pyridoxal phosphate-dependent decarboxylase family protein [Sinimarinibacterium sp. CAU 1509]|uniref:pyridoxal phosphate-dependent decarboxylase family protein n=1 Tax=Sinimarinibacterium sp. CAU 1509 TaxID=2562283 RepID=UPI001B7FC82A|nr:pyridoxal-dependent decarboxylase [Sinimarinibacterium sp. CAU 1509]